MNFIASLESFIGVLYAGFCCAVLFGKVQCIYSRAMASFSNVCVINYGPGWGEDDDDDDDYYYNENNHSLVEHDSTPEKPQSLRPQKSIPYPVLTFRVVNERANHIFGSISNLDVGVVVIIEKKNPSTSAGRLTAPRRRFRELNIEPTHVPLFDRILYVRHILNGTSPLLNQETRRMIRKNNGKWPSDFSTPEKVRSTLNVAQLVVSLKGISDLSKATVYSQKIYGKDEIKIGWRFVDMTYKTEGKSKLEYEVDFDLINVVMEQAEGEGEELTEPDNSSHG